MRIIDFLFQKRTLRFNTAICDIAISVVYQTSAATAKAFKQYYRMKKRSISAVKLPFEHSICHLLILLGVSYLSEPSLHRIQKQHKQNNMKNLKLTSTMFTTKMSRAAAQGLSFAIQTKSPITFKRTILSLLLMGILLIGTSSCSRNVSSGCGTWPVAKINKTQYRSDTWPVKVKNDNQFANYKNYN